MASTDQVVNFSELDDGQLWQVIRDGNMEALSFIYKSFYSDLYYYGLKCSGNKPLVEDCIQDLFVRLWKSRENIEIKSIKPYLLTSFRRTLLEKLASKSEQMKGQGEIPENFNPELSMEDVTIKLEWKKERLKDLENGLMLLTKRQKEIIYLRFYQELSYDEISEMMDIKYQSVRNSIHESIKLIKNNLAGMILLLGSIEWF